LEWEETLNKSRAVFRAAAVAAAGLELTGKDI
jgi:anthranilate/para-aminobenzoate synthase component I